jgi:hypothetical protein
MSKKMTVVAVLVASAVCSFSLVRPSVARSAIRTVAGQGCRQRALTATDGVASPNEFICSLTLDPQFPLSALSGVYADFVLERGTPAESSNGGMAALVKYSYTGTEYVDVVQYSPVPTATRIDQWIPASQVKLNASDWDYLEVDVMNVHLDTFMGVAMVNDL